METIGRPGLLDPDARPGRAGWLVAAAGLVLLAGAAAWWWGRGWHPFVGIALLSGGIALAAPFARARRRAQTRRVARMLETWGRERGLLLVDRMGNPQATPLLRTRGLLGPVLLGPVGGDPSGMLAHYAYTLQTGQGQHVVPFTVAIARCGAPAGLRLTVHAAAPTTVFQRLVDEWRPYATASAEVDARFAIEVGDGHDPVLVAELLDPVVLADLLDEDAPVGVEVDGGCLVVWVGGFVGVSEGVEDLAWLDVLRDRCDRWAERLARI